MEHSYVARLRSSRSRSRTPQNFSPVPKNVSSEDSDNIFTTTKTLRTRTVHTRHRTSDYSSEDLSPESHKDLTGSNNYNHSTETTSTGGNSSSRKHVYQTGSNNGFSTSTAEHPAYKEYHDAGEYWNKFPKTDYTYSKRSPHRREIANGYVAMPNMSRRSISGYSDRAASFTNSNNINFEKYRQTHIHTSQTDVNKVKRKLQSYLGKDEIDNNYANERYVQQHLDKKWYQVIWIKILSVTTWFSNLFIRKTDPNVSVYRTPLRSSYQTTEKKSILSRITSRLTMAGLYIMSWIYWLMGTVLLIDCTLLRWRGDSSSGSVAPRPSAKLLWLLVLVPLAILGGFYLYLLLDESNYDITIPNLNPLPKPLSEYTSDVSQSLNEYYEMLKLASYNGGQELHGLWREAAEFSQNAINYLTE